jgi:hypothetical protein
MNLLLYFWDKRIVETIETPLYHQKWFSVIIWRGEGFSMFWNGKEIKRQRLKPTIIAIFRKKTVIKKSEKRGNASVYVIIVKKRRISLSIISAIFMLYWFDPTILFNIKVVVTENIYLRTMADQFVFMILKHSGIYVHRKIIHHDFVFHNIHSKNFWMNTKQNILIRICS